MENRARESREYDRAYDREAGIPGNGPPGSKVSSASPYNTGSTYTQTSQFGCEGAIQGGFFADHYFSVGRWATELTAHP